SPSLAVADASSHRGDQAHSHSLPWEFDLTETLPMSRNYRLRVCISMQKLGPGIDCANSGVARGPRFTTTIVAIDPGPSAVARFSLQQCRPVPHSVVSR